MRFGQLVASLILFLCSFSAFAGGWDVGPFDNDDALDWVWELSESNDLSVVEEAVQSAISTSGYLEAPTASIAVAAAEVVAALKGQPRAQLPDEVTSWVASNQLEVDDQLVKAARQAIVHVKNSESSELAQLWSDSEELLNQWHKDLADLERRLR